MRDAQLLKFIISVNHKIAEIRELDKLLSYAMEQALELVEAEFGYIVLRNQAGEFEQEIFRVEDNAEEEQMADGVSHSIVQDVINSRKSLVLTNAMTDPRFSDVQSVLTRRLRSVMCVPLQTQNNIIGAVYVENRSVAGMFHQEDVEPLEFFANQAAVLIENARLFQQAQQEIERRKAIEIEIRELNAELENRVRIRTNELEYANQELEALSLLNLT